MTTLQKHKNTVKGIEKKLRAIEKENPEFDFDNHELRSAVRKYEELIKKIIYAQVDLSMCSSESFMKTCSVCDCGKTEVKR